MLNNSTMWLICVLKVADVIRCNENEYLITMVIFIYEKWKKNKRTHRTYLSPLHDIDAEPPVQTVIEDASEI